VSLPPLLRIVRPALAPTAACDVLAAALLAGATDPGRLVLATGASVCLYMGGMAQNDLFDRLRDADLAPDRPLVREPRLVPRARLLVLALFAAGLVLAGFAGVLREAAIVAVLATAYNAGLKRVFPADALTMGGARAANLAIGCAVAGAYEPLFLAGYLLYIAGVTAASRACT
jgi:4-hydroxybenzoate polyprenyltransferase